MVRYRLVVPLFRSPHSAEHTARGVANGVFWGLTPTIGLQTFEIVATWFIARRLGRDSSLLQAFIWAWINNPLTVVPMYYVFYVTGLWLTGHHGDAAGYEAFGALLRAGEGPWLSRVTTLMRAVGGPLLLGCIPYATLGAALSYGWARRVVQRRQQRRARRKRAIEAGGDV